MHVNDLRNDKAGGVLVCLGAGEREEAPEEVVGGQFSLRIDKGGFFIRGGGGGGGGGGAGGGGERHLGDVWGEGVKYIFSGGKFPLSLAHRNRNDFCDLRLSACAPLCCKNMCCASRFCTGGGGAAGSRSKQCPRARAAKC